MNENGHCEPASTSSSPQYATIRTKKPGRLERLTGRKKREWLDAGCDHGFVRLYAPAGSRSIVYPLTIKSTVQDVCSVLGFEELYLQIGGLHISALAGTSNEILIAKCLVRKGRILQKWIKRRCILYNGTIRIEYENEDDEILLLSRYRVQVAEGSKGKYLRLSDASQVYCFLFEAIGEMNLWLSRVIQTQMAPSCDLSDQGLLFLPDRLFSVGVERQIISLNLRRNSLVLRPNDEVHSPPLGWLDDVHRLINLRSLNIADNALHSFPSSVTRLTALTELILCGNRITELSPQIGLLHSLSILNVSNNWLATLPFELAECSSLCTLDLSFNRFEQIPDVLFNLKRLSFIQLAGNEISSSSLHALSGVRASKLDLRRNVLKRSIRLTSFIFDSLCEVDVRDNVNLSELDFSNLPTLQVVRCERIGLSNLQINGSSLRYLYADHNDLSQAIIMPIPIHLIVFCIPYNRLVSLPDWITDLPQIETISVHHNFIKHLPYRIFMNASSLKNLFVNDNDIERLPDVVENCSLEVLSLHNNHIEQLPVDLLRCAHRLKNLNVSNNRLLFLPSANSMIDLNRLQLLRAANNRLDESVISTVVSCRRLRLLDLSYNQLRFFDDSCLMRLTALEEVNLSSNRLSSVSPAFGVLPNLQILRLHSNMITSIPDLSHSPSLFLLDLSNNELENLNTDLCMAKTLKHLDLTCNIALRVDSSTIRPKRRGRLVSVVDVGSESTFGPFQFGFSETAGQKNKLCIRQIRPKNGNRCVFGMVDGGSNDEIPSLIAEKLDDYVQQKVILGANSLKTALLRSHEHLGQMGERLGASALLLYVSREQLLCATSGHVRAVLCRNGDACDITGDKNTVITDEEYRRIRHGNAVITQDNLIEGVCRSTRSLGFSFLYPAVVPNPIKITVPLLDSDEFIIIGSSALWKFISPQQSVDFIRAIHNPQTAAKKLQFGFSETAGQKNKLCIRQIRPKNGNRCVFGMVDGGSNDEIPSLIAEKLDDYVQQKVILGANSLKTALLRSHEHLGQMGERLGASALLLYVSREQLLCATSGHVRAVLCRNGDACDITGDKNTVITDEEYRRIRHGNAVITQDNLIEGVCRSTRSLGFSFLYPAVVPNPIKITVPLLDSDEFIIIGSSALWKFISPQQSVDFIRAIHNPQTAAKKLQDTVQSLEYSDNLSIIVIRLAHFASEVQESRSVLRRTQIAVNYNKEELTFSDGELSNRGESTLRSIEERLEQISEAISKIEDDSNNNRSIENGINQINLVDKNNSSFRRSVRKSKKHRSLDVSRVSVGSGPSFSSRGSQVDLTSTTIPSRTASAASAPPDPQTSDTARWDGGIQRDAHRERFSIRSRIDMFDRMSGLGTVASRERFQRARIALGEHLRLETPGERKKIRQYLL
ncbi:Protein phosphatase PHLPP-like protein [Toxocara canis]|uniref:Protein phosphatase PHLPP-like protein n=1 Tax=Toxocara canis TaxID=6265 RepID=A0A0B2V6D2_TOXCA|nr:Protein phosphatase PHLPP-like protein [Toxocara canis]